MLKKVIDNNIQNSIDTNKSQMIFSWGIFVERLITENNNDKKMMKTEVSFIFLENELFKIAAIFYKLNLLLKKKRYIK